MTTHLNRWTWAGAGAAAGLAGLAAGQLIGAILAPDSAPLFAVGAAVIDLTPTPVKTWAVAILGVADKTVLLAIVSLIAVGLCALAGVLARRRPGLGFTVLGVLGVLVAGAALARPGSTPLWLLPAAGATAVGIVTLGWLRSILTRELPIGGRRATPQRSTAGRPAATSQSPASTAHPTPEGDPPVAASHAVVPGSPKVLDLTEPIARTPTQPDRREFLMAGTVVVGASTLTLLGSTALLGRATPTTGPAPVALPVADRPLAPLPTGVESQIPGVSPFVTDNANFYRIDTALSAPRLSREDWSLRIDGEVDNPFTLRWGDLEDFEFIERDITMICVSNDVGGGYVGSARWLGVRTSDILERAGVRPGVEQIRSMDIAGMTISTPVQALLDDREALLAIGMNGEPLPRDHGFPARLVTPGLYGFVGSTKWVTQLTATSYAAAPAYWTTRGWDTGGLIYTQTRIDTPGTGSRIDPDVATHIGGVAWAQQRGIDGVEVSIDGGPWQQATLGPDAGIDYWVQWYLPWTPAAGVHEITARATDKTGETQTEVRRPPYPEGASGYHIVQVEAR